MPTYPGIASGLGQQASSPAAGTAFTGGTPTFLSWTAPNDGKLHFAMIFGTVIVSVAQTGGGVQINATLNGAGRNAVVLTASQAVGTYNLESNSSAQAGWGTPAIIAVDPGTTVSVVQSAAQTAGAATFYGAIYGQ